MGREAEENWLRCWREAGGLGRLDSQGEGSVELVGRVFESSKEQRGQGAIEW